MLEPPGLHAVIMRGTALCNIRVGNSSGALQPQWACCKDECHTNCTLLKPESIAESTSKSGWCQSLLAWGLQGANGTASAVGAVPIVIHIVVKLAVVGDLAVRSIDPVLTALAVCQVRAIPRTKGVAVSESAVQPVNASVTHAEDLALALKPCTDA